MKNAVMDVTGPTPQIVTHALSTLSSLMTMSALVYPTILERCARSS